MNIFEKASRLKLRFETTRGPLTVESLWDMPLTHRAGFDLDNLAKGVNAELKAVSEESFVSTKTNPLKDLYELQLAIIKYVIADKMAEAEKYKQRLERDAKRQKLVEALGNKENEELSKMSKDDILKQLAELD